MSFRELRDHRSATIPCGVCIGCRIRKSEAWAFRCMAEAQMHERNCFLTLTYDDQHLPADGSLDHRHWQLFAKRLREKYGKFRFFMCGEYGEKTGRAHYHALVFGLDFAHDRVQYNASQSRHPLWRSPSLDKLWGNGSVTIGSVSYQTAAYVAGYVIKRVDPIRWAEQNERVNPETGQVIVRKQQYGKMSLKPGLGKKWLEKYQMEVKTHDGVYVHDRKMPVPRYFDSLLAAWDPADSDSRRMARSLAAVPFALNNTRERLAVREECAHAKSAFFNGAKTHEI